MDRDYRENKENKDEQFKTIAEQVAIVAKKALKRIVANRLLPWPNIYEKEFWAICHIENFHNLLEKRDIFPEVTHIEVEKFLKETEEILGGVHGTVDEFVEDTKAHIDNMGSAISELSSHNIEDEDIASHIKKLSAYNESLRKKAQATEKKLLEQSIMIKELKEQLRLDPLTSLLNRHALKSDLTKELSRCFRYNMPLAVMMLDIDNFKMINDTYGHVTGDKVLKKLAEIFTDSVRDTDSVYRYGGEEYFVLCPHTDCNSAVNMAERLRARIKKYEFVLENPSERFSITISIGVTTAVEGDTIETIIKRADEALYSSKLSGKDRTTKICL